MGVALTWPAWSAETEDDLNLDFLQGGRNAQASAFLAARHAYYPGRYWVDVQLNHRSVGKRVLNVTEKESDALCFSPTWLASIDTYVRRDFYQSTYRQDDDCYVLSEQPDSTVDFDLSTQTLRLSLPQAGLAKADEGLSWGFGNNALRLNYNANANKTTEGVDYYGSGSLLANLGEWIARGSASLTQDEQSLSVFTISKAVLALQADLILGKTSVSSGELGGLSTYGMTLSSNAAMRRQTQGYTPVFSGTATSNARVTLRQGNTVLYSEIVPPGPFRIDDVTVLSGGDVVMSITESDGTTTTQVFPITLMSGQISPGEHEYSVSLGVIDNDNPDGTPTGGLGAFSYGYGLESMSVRVGALVGSQFTGVTGEVTSQLGPFGSISAALSGTQSRYDEGNRQGQKTTLTFAKTFDIGTSFRLAYNQLSEAYDTLGEYNDLAYESLKRRQRLKEDITIGVSQPLWQGATFSVNGWQRRYWQRDDKQQGLTGNLSTRIGQVSVSLAGSYYKTGRDNQYSFSTSVSVPFSVFERDFTTYASMSGGKTGGNSYSAGASTSLTDRWSMAVNENWGGDGNLGAQTSVWTAYDGRLAQLSGQMTRTDNGTLGSGSINGSVMYLPADNSLLFGKNISDTVAVVHVPDGAGVTMLGGLDKADRNGNLMVPLSSYQVNTLSIEASSLPSDMELSVTSKKIKPTGGSVTYVPFEGMSVRRYLLQVRRPNGQFIPAGEWAYAESGAPLGFVSHNGVILINAVDALSAIRFSDCRVPGAQLTESSRLQEVVCEY
ncbi:fimbria/pilus outer membrane usher protein [Providencia rettgeri]|uniref:Fimbria/pilus outer membrane usher protein n=1 Tax=Providencia rettgeri TaxID=587 RepID=A0AAE2ZIQ6_PRORE|nr:fimbria/pilus outer membrane usher protein [Providencia rettgeri]